MLAYCYVIIADVDPQLRQRLVFAECSTEKCEALPSTRVCLLTLNIVTNKKKSAYIFSELLSAIYLILRGIYLGLTLEYNHDNSSPH